jgi:hypothetical protein
MKNLNLSSTEMKVSRILNGCRSSPYLYAIWRGESGCGRVSGGGDRRIRRQDAPKAHIYDSGGSGEAKVKVKTQGRVEGEGGAAGAVEGVMVGDVRATLGAQPRGKV